MVYSYYLNGIISTDSEALLSALPFYFIGAAVAWLLTCLGHALGCSIFKADRGEMGASYNPLKNLSLYSVLGFLSFPLFGVGWTKPTRYLPESRKKSLAVSLSGPVFCFLVSLVFLFVYTLTSTPFFGSLTMGIATAGIWYSVINLLPLPGLCGGVALAAILPENLSHRWVKLFEYYPLIITAFVLLLVRSEVSVYVAEQDLFVTTQANVYALEKVIEFLASLFN